MDGASASCCDEVGAGLGDAEGCGPRLGAEGYASPVPRLAHEPTGTVARADARPSVGTVEVHGCDAGAALLASRQVIRRVGHDGVDALGVERGHDFEAVTGKNHDATSHAGPRGRTASRPCPRPAVCRSARAVTSWWLARR